MRAYEILRLDELVNAPDQEVYHWTSAPSLFKMIRDNVVTAGTVHEIDGKDVSGISLSRNALFDIQDTYRIGGIKAWRIGFNLRKLKADHKVVPIRYKPYRNIPRGKTIKDGNFDTGMLSFRDSTSDEAEEFCIGEIYPLWHYVSSLAVEMRNVDFVTHPKEIARWEPEDFDDGDGSFGSAYSKEDQGLLFDILVGTYYGQGPYQEIWKHVGAGRRASAIKLPANVPFNVIDREKNTTIPFSMVAKGEMERYALAPPEKPDNAGMKDITVGKPTRGERNAQYDNTDKFKKSEPRT